MNPSKLLFGLIVSLACLQLARGAPGSFSPLSEYVFVSQPAEGSVAMTEINTLTRQVVHEAQAVISTGLREPNGLAVDHDRQRLYVADPKQHKVFMYKLYTGKDGVSVREDQQYVAVHDVTARWVAVDDKGTLFATDEKRSFIAKVDAFELAKLGQKDADVEDVRTHVQKLYSEEMTRQVDHPGGIAVDGNNVYWGNRKRGRPYGSLLQAPEDPQKKVQANVPTMIQALSKNVDKVYGVCASPNLVFYTGGSRTVYGAKQGSYQARASTTVLLNDFAVPRGCVWDGDGTMLLADKGGDAVWSFPSSLHGLGLVQASKLFEVKDPYGVALFRPALSLDSVGFLRGASLKTLPAFTTVLAMLAIFAFNV